MNNAEFRQFQEQLAESARQAGQTSEGRLDDTTAQLIRSLAYLAQYAREMAAEVAVLTTRIAALETRVTGADDFGRDRPDSARRAT